MNHQFFYEEFFLMFLYKVREVNTNQMEPILEKTDEQLINNIICNRNNSTSPIKRKLLEYDEDYQILKITHEGDLYIENKFKHR